MICLTTNSFLIPVCFVTCLRQPRGRSCWRPHEPQLAGRHRSRLGNGGCSSACSLALREQSRSYAPCPGTWFCLFAAPPGMPPPPGCSQTGNCDCGKMKRRSPSEAQKKNFFISNCWVNCLWGLFLKMQTHLLTLQRCDEPEIIAVSHEA